MGMVRLQKYLAECGIGSRRKCEEYIGMGLIKVNGDIVTELGTKVDPLSDQIEFRDVLDYLEKYYIDVEEYDVVIGYRADDAYFRFPLMFVRNLLTFEKLEEIYMLGNLGKQYVLISQKAFERLKSSDSDAIKILIDPKK